MFHAQIAEPEGINQQVNEEKRKPENRELPTSAPSETEMNTDNTSQFARVKTQEYMRNVRLAYIYQRGIMF
ncbi:hypothetical protein [Calothrix sp. NIES-3974]|uniref:hypothetical protein n=1 Tax=Calothrix sp. NIES-3974 TaxID=2005462 RepID=UPI000B61AF7D|nr:hypothetical protein [Calothrix sp. NIES-3974]BAZ07315.1 hypothetical protein NIES3974_39780 [Calothrix sp. NIES-3974]